MRAGLTLLLCAAAAMAPYRAVAFAPEHRRLKPPRRDLLLPPSGATRARFWVERIRGGSQANTHTHGPHHQRPSPELRSASSGNRVRGDGDSEGNGVCFGASGVTRAASGVPLLKALGKFLYSKVQLTGTLRAVFGAVPSFWYWIRGNSGDKGKEYGVFSGPIGHRRFVDSLHSTKTYRLCVLYTLGYLALSVGAYSYIFESWPIVDSLYFAVTCFTSVGYGDICPQTRGAKIFTAFFVVYGISLLGIALGIVGSQLVEAERFAVKKVGDSVKRRLLSVFRNRVDAGTAGEPPVEQQEPPSPSLLASIADLVLTQTPNLALIAAMALWIGRTEGWSVLTSLYYGVITTTTVGLGDFSPSTRFARLLAVFFIPLSVAVLGELLGRIAGFFVDREGDRIEREFLERDLTEEDLSLMDADENGDVDLAEFMTFMLVTMGKVDRETMDELRDVFDSLDAESNGFLNKKDLELLALRKSKVA